MPYTNKSRGAPKMQRAHFEMIAGVLKTARDHFQNYRGTAHPARVTESVALEFAHSLAATNPNFRRDDFLSACGIEE